MSLSIPTQQVINFFPPSLPQYRYPPPSEANSVSVSCGSVCMHLSTAPRLISAMMSTCLVWTFYIYLPLKAETVHVGYSVMYREGTDIRNGQSLFQS